MYLKEKYSTRMGQGTPTRSCLQWLSASASWLWPSPSYTMLSLFNFLCTILYVFNQPNFFTI